MKGKSGGGAFGGIKKPTVLQGVGGGGGCRNINGCNGMLRLEKHGFRCWVWLEKGGKQKVKCGLSECG